MNNFLSDKKKFTIATLEDDTSLNFGVKHEKHVDTVLKKLLTVWQKKTGT